MRELQKPVRQAQRRLWLNRWLDRLGWSATIAAGAFMAAVVLLRALAFTDDETRWLGIVALILLAGVTVVSAALAFLGWTRAVTAAEYLDESAGLKERISSALACAPSADPFAQAVVADARRHVGRINVPRCIPIRCPRSAGYAASVGLLAVLMFWVFPELDLIGSRQKRNEKQQNRAAVERTAVMIKPVLEQARKELEKKNPELAKELDKLDPLAMAQVNNPLDLQRETMKKLDHLAIRLEHKRADKNLEQVGDFKKMLRSLAAQENRQESAVSELSRKLAQGDFKGAQQAIEQLKKQLEQANTPEQKQQAEQLKKQLSELGDKLEQLSKNDKQLRDELNKSGLTAEQIEKALQNIKKEDLEAVKKQLQQQGMSQKQIQQVMQKLQSQCSACKSAGQMGKNFKQAAAGKSGSPAQGQNGQQSLAAAGQQLSEMEAMEQELNQLNNDMEKLGACKSQLGNCDGQSSGQCPSMGQSPGGRGAGLGQGQGAPQPAIAFHTRKERSSVKTLPGGIISQRYVDGEQFKGEVSQEFSEAQIAAERQVSDAIAREQIPRVYHEPLKKYFSRNQNGSEGESEPADEPRK